jgi:hypothetical protein
VDKQVGMKNNPSFNLIDNLTFAHVSVDEQFTLKLQLLKRVSKAYDAINTEPLAHIATSELRAYHR